MVKDKVIKCLKKLIQISSNYIESIQNLQNYYLL